MYEQHFGLNSRPFGAKAEGAAVFVGPLQAKIISSLTKGLAATDAVVTVTGAVGVGKTTMVSRALESISPGRMVAWVGRMQLAPDEVLELLLAGFGVKQQTRGTIQRFAAFRRLLAERAAAGAQVAIVVEDAQRLGIDALVEIEALTAADAGDSTSANIILMGQPQLNKMMATPELARMAQRNRLRQKIEPLNEAEVAGYVKHCLREAGGDFDTIFDSGVCDILFKCSQGVPRIINNLCETALSAAMQDGLSRVSVGMMQQVAADAFEYEGTGAHSVLETSTDEMSRDPFPKHSECLDAAVPSDTGEATASKSESMPVPEFDAVPQPQASLSAAEDTNDIPELINDTHPELKKLEQNAKHDDSEVEATQTQKTLAYHQADEAASEEEGTANFSLDDALSVDAGETNLMPGITPNLDQMASKARQTGGTPTSPAGMKENIPTLSNSMRIDVDDEVDKAKQEMAQEAASEAEAQSAPPGISANALGADQPAAPSAQEPAQPASNETPKQPEIETRNSGTVDTTKAEAPLTTSKMPESAAESAPAEKDSQQPPSTAGESSIPQTMAEASSQSAPEAPEQAPVDPASKLLPTKAPESADQKTDAWSGVGHDTDAPDSVEATDLPVEPLLVDTSELPQSEPEPAGIAKSPDANAAIPEKQKPAELTLEPPGEKPVANAAMPAKEIATQVPPGAVANASAAKPGADRRLPDIDALEKALDAAKSGDLATDSDAPPAASMKPAVQEETPVAADVPEITLDDALPKAPDVDPELLKVAEQIGRASSLEDMTDVMAETIFGSEAFDEIAAAVVSNPPEEEETSPVMLDESQIPEAANDAGKQEGAKVTATTQPANETLSQSAADRLDMVKALNNGAGPAAVGPREDIQLGNDNPDKPPKPRGPQPEPIEQQITTSMTQTLKALSAAKPAQENPEEEEKKSGGLFSRFRKSS